MSMAERFFTMSQHAIDFHWRDARFQELVGVTVNLKRNIFGRLVVFSEAASLS